jgi:Kef-type K+ transport system membrane component KefB
MATFSLLLLQIVIILVLAKTFNVLFRKIHQPQVIGEMFAGLILGPSVFQYFAPNLSNLLFPPESLGLLSALGQIGIILYLFLVGLELDTSLLRKHAYSALIVGPASLIIPFVLGILLALYIHDRLGEPGNLFTFSLFLGTALCVTAFPVLTRILVELDLLRTKVGVIALACAALDDVIAWYLLAIVLIIRTSTLSSSFWMTIIGSGIYILAMLFVFRRLFSGLERAYLKTKNIGPDLLLLILLALLISAWITDWLGIHTIFGAFLAGVIMPKGTDFVHAVKKKLEDVTLVLLVPIFFSITGLKTSIILINGSAMWAAFALLMVVAIAGKFGSATLSAKFTGMNWREASAIGVLMNTKGLMELVVLNIGLDIGVISPSLFAMMVLMTFVTTFMATPLLKWIYPLKYHST